MKAGYKLTVNDIDPAPVRELEQLGAHGVKTPREVAENSDVVITMVVDGDQVRTIALGEEGLVKGSRRGLILVDMTSVNRDAGCSGLRRGCEGGRWDPGDHGGG